MYFLVKYEYEVKIFMKRLGVHNEFYNLRKSSYYLNVFVAKEMHVPTYYVRI